MKKILAISTFILIFTISVNAASAVIPRKIIRTTANTEPEVTEDLREREIGEPEQIEEAPAEPEEVKEVDTCGYEAPEENKFSSQVITVRRKLRVEPGEIYRVKVFLKNTGNIPWFSEKSQCQGYRVFLGSDRPRDRESDLYISDLKVGEEVNGWLQANRIDMDQYRTDPGEIASFTFWTKAGQEADVIQEYFTPVAEGVKWLDEAGFKFQVLIGDVGEDMQTIRKRFTYVNVSGSVMDINLNGEKMLLVDISDQTVTLYLDGYEIEKFQVSTGKSSTPTPYGETTITLKQQVRVGHAPPHYVMPKFQMFRSGGYGFHALPSLANDGGVFWTEARNHIGIPVSHGCIRLLPEDANYLFDFTEIGTRVVVQP